MFRSSRRVIKVLHSDKVGTIYEWAIGGAPEPLLATFAHGKPIKPASEAVGLIWIKDEATIGGPLRAAGQGCGL